MIDPISLKHAEKRREAILKAMPEMQVSPGWIRYTRTLFGLTLKALGELTGLSLSTVSQAEQREAEGKVTMDTLKKIAKAMDCEFVYAFVPKDNIEEFLLKKAKLKATKILQKANTHMALEDQEVDESMEERVERLAQKLFKEGDVW